jgi:hypothetical protein
METIIPKKTAYPSVKEIQDNYYYHYCEFTFKSGIRKSGNFRHNNYKEDNKIKGWYVTFDKENSISTVFHDQIALIERLD